MYEYGATLLKIIDGDTLDLLLDLGLDVRLKTRVRLFGVNCPETRSQVPSERAAGAAAVEFVKNWLALRPSLRVRTILDKSEKFGRYLAVLYGEDDPAETGDWSQGSSLNALLVRGGHAVVYYGGKRVWHAGQ